MPDSGDLTHDDIPKDVKGPSASPAPTPTADAGIEVGGSPPPANDNAGFTVGNKSATPKPKPEVKLGEDNLESGLQDSPTPVESIESGVGGDKDEEPDGQVKQKDKPKKLELTGLGGGDIKGQPTFEEAEIQRGKIWQSKDEHGNIIGAGVNLERTASFLKDSPESLSDNLKVGMNPDLKAGLGKIADGVKGMWGKLTGGGGPKPEGPSPDPSTTSDNKDDDGPAAPAPKSGIDGPKPAAPKDGAGASDKSQLDGVGYDDTSKSSSGLEDSMKPQKPAPPGAGSTTPAADKKKDEDAAAAAKPKEPAPDTKPSVDPTDPSATATKSGPKGP